MADDLTPRPAAPTAVALAALAAAAGAVACTPALRERQQRPAPLAADWVDPKHVAPGDTSVWRLAPDGTDLRVRIRSRPVVAAPDSEASRYGTWFLRGAIADTAGRALCFAPRATRSQVWCLRFALDTLADGRRELVVYNYHGTHGVGTRTLVERRP